MSRPEFTGEQARAIGRRDGSVLVSAGAGSGKTSVLVERFVQAVLEDDCAVDSILAITFTEKAAAQLTGRVRRAASLELGEQERAREAEAAWISTIHGFCARLLRTHALAAGLDPEFRVLDALEAERLAIDAFDRALARLRGHGRGPRAGWRCWPPTRRTSWPTWCAPPTRTCAARAARARGCRRCPRRAPPGQREALRAGRRAPPWPRSAPHDDRDAPRRPREAGALRLRCWRRWGPDEVAEPAELSKLGFKPTRQGAPGPGVRGLPRGARGLPGLLPRTTASTTTTCCCAS